ncbi:hypothetical protein GALMADRAFT_265248 [Galerina marginata CBS 339.88]|uniref:Uncharacterized protein n=1 Tax=Galerina marginata (strain CBS 339.88) TaxID=685588 RepID=A0A067TJG6_GALM3|nr:hypothetical protein GALMADRAFT_265248 [Galerina marginata CBS 339.88]
MPISKHTTEFERRPTLPSIHTLNLPSLSRSSHRNVKYETHDNLRRTPTNAMHHERQVSTSSSHTSISRNTSPSPSPLSDVDSDGETTPQTKFRLVPCPLEVAEAIIVVSDEPITSQRPNYAPQQGKGQSILIVGPSVQRFRNPQRPLAKGSRIHPYRIVRGPKTSDLRRSSVVSITAFSPNTQ